MVGLLGIAALIPLLTVSIVAGAVADAVDRRRLLLVSDLGLAAVTVVLLLNALADDPSLPLLFALRGRGDCGVRVPASGAGTRSRRSSCRTISCSQRSRSRTSCSTSRAWRGLRSPAC